MAKRRSTAPSWKRTAAILGGVLAVGTVTWLVLRDDPADCSKATAEGGEVAGIRYLETVRGADANARLPMVISFHSRGGTARGAGSFSGLKGVRIIRPYGFNKSGDGYTWFTKSSSKQPEQLTVEMRGRSKQLAEFIEQITQCRPTAGRPIVTGSSEGGHVSYLLASTQPDLVSGAVALLGYLPPGLWNARMAPTVAMHTLDDETINYGRTKAYWDAMKAKGADLHTQTFEGGHQVTAAMGSAWNQAVRTMVERLS